MTTTFFLRKPKWDKKTLILFSCYFKDEGKKFVYSTGETIHPEHWDFENRMPTMRGNKKASDCGSIKRQLGRYVQRFELIQERCKLMQEDFTSQLLRKAFDEEFKKAPAGKNIFFDAYDLFEEQKIKNREWSESTVKRYNNIQNILIEFEKERNYKLSFSAINSKFHSEFTDFCMGTKKHINNTYSRNLGLFKTFMFWALENGFTYNEEFKKFRKKEKVITAQIALKKEDLEKLMKQEFETKKLEKVRDVFVFACVTGLRFGELKLISKENIIDGYLHLKEEKGAEKEARTIPLNDFALFILRKYDYNLPLIANQKHNEYIKEVFEKAGYDQMVEKITTRGKEVIREKYIFKDRISTHTARRTFITMLKRDGKSDKLISKITGHKDLKTLNQYYQVEDEAKKEAIDSTFKFDYLTVKKAN